MASDPGQIQIGVTLRDARRRYGMEVREVEDRTMIRARYIRALESEDWDTLPAPAYIRGFLRTYGQLLGLDGEMLVDEFRRQHDAAVAAAGGPPPGEPVLTERRRLGGGGPSRGLLVVGAVAGLIVLLVALSTLGGDDGEGPPAGGSQASEQEQRAERQRRRQRRREREREAAANEPQEVKATLEALTTVAVCLVAGSDTALIDNQTLGVDAKEKFDGNKRYRLTIGPGSVRFVVGDEEQTLEVAEPTSFRGDSEGIREISYRGPDCP